MTRRDRKPVKIFFLLIVMAVLTLVLSAISHAQDDPAPMASLRWEVYGLSLSGSAAVVGPDSTIYVAAEDGVYALNADGSTKWLFETSERVDATPAIDYEGNIYAGDRGGFLYSITPDGALRWKYKTGGVIIGGAAIAYDGTIYIGSRDGYLYAVSSEGELQWKTVTGQGIIATNIYSCIETTPVIGRDGTIYVGSKDQNIYAITPWGTWKWLFLTANGIWENEPALGPDGTIYQTGMDNFLYAINLDGTMKWRYHVDNAWGAIPAVGANGTVYVNLYNFCRIPAINPDGTVAWSMGGRPYRLSPPVIGYDGTIYAVSEDDHLYAMNPDGEMKWRCFIGMHASYTSPTLTRNGMILLVRNADIFSFDIENEGYDPEASWPGFTASPQRSVMTGNAVLPPLHKVRGQVALPDSTPLVDVPVSVNGLTVLTDDFGYYTLILPDGEYTVKFNITSTMIPKRADFIVAGGDVFVDMPMNLNTIQGRLMDRDGPVSGVTAHVGDRTSVTDEDGRYSFSLPDGAYTIEFNLPAGSFPSLKGVEVQGNDVMLDDQYLYHESWRRTYSGDFRQLLGFDGPEYQFELQHHTLTIEALDTDGAVRHEYTIDTAVYDIPVLADGTLYVSVHDSLVTLTPDLEYKWTYSDPEFVIDDMPSIGADGTLYVGSILGRVYALNPDGTVQWIFPTGESVYFSPLVGPDGTLYVSCADYNFYALNPDGTLRWKLDFADDLPREAVMGDDGTLYFSTDYFSFNAVNPDGTLKWTMKTPGRTNDSAILGPDGTIYFADTSGWIYAVDPDGTVKWTYPVGKYGPQPFYFDPADEIWAWNENETIALNLDGSVKWRHDTVLAPDIVGGGRMFVRDSSADSDAWYLRAFDIPGLPVSVEEEYRDEHDHDTEAMPSVITLHLNYPNPFNPVTTISFTLAAESLVTVDIYTITGQHAGRLAHEYMTAGEHRISWDGSEYPAGVYFTRIAAGDAVSVRKMLLLK